MQDLVKRFTFGTVEIKATIEDNQPWFNAKDICNALGYENHRKALKDHVDSEDVTNRYGLADDNKMRKIPFINESGLYALIFGSKLPSAKAFKKWVTSEVLPTIRKTGSYSLKDFILTSPTKWERTFPEEFFRQVMKVYNYSYTPSQGTPQFVGKFIDKYIYSSLDKGMTKALKTVRNTHKEISDEFSLLHQFVNEEGREPLKSHIMVITHFLTAASNISQFETMYNRVFIHKNQYEMYLR